MTEYRVLVKGGLGLMTGIAQEGDTVWPTQIGDDATVQRWVEQGAIEPTGASDPVPAPSKGKTAAAAVEEPPVTLTVVDHEADTQTDDTPKPE